MRTRDLVVPCAVVLGFAAASFPRSAPAQPQLQTEGRVGSYRVQDVAAFNLALRTAHQAADGGWTTTPLGVVSRYLGDLTAETQAAIVEVMKPSAESHDRVIVMVTREGLLDDSVRGMKDRLELVRDPAGFWSIAGALRAWTCRPGRGHVEYLADLCR
jgi:hypothetical protein